MENWWYWWVAIVFGIWIVSKLVKKRKAQQQSTDGPATGSDLRQRGFMSPEPRASSPMSVIGSPRRQKPVSRSTSFLGILFDIDGLGGGFYGEAAYQILFKSVDTGMLRNVRLHDGDTAHTPAPDGVRLYCIAVESDDTSLLRHIENRLSVCQETGLRPRASRFLRGAEAVRQEPLVLAGVIDAQGVLVHCDTPWIQKAWPEDLRMTYDVVLTEAGNDAYAVLKELRAQVDGLGLAEARKLVRNAPVTVMSSLPKNKAFEAKERLEAAGAKAQIK